jgi:zinc transport system substrate-binding protein
VLTVNAPLAYFAERITNDVPEQDLRVRFPAPAQVDPAFWQPSADVIGAYQSAQMILLNGAGYARWTSTATLPRSSQVDTGAAFAQQNIELADTVSHTHGSEGEHSHGELAFTTWLDFELASQQVRAISQALTAALPQHSESFASQTAALLQDLSRLHEQLLALGDSPPLLASHPVYQYLARRYELELRSVHWEPDALPNDAQWAAFETLLAEQSARSMLWEAQPLPTVVDALAQRGVSVIVYEPCGNLPADGDFLQAMTRNVAGLTRAFEALNQY